MWILAMDMMDMLHQILSKQMIPVGESQVGLC